IGLDGVDGEKYGGKAEPQQQHHRVDDDITDERHKETAQFAPDQCQIRLHQWVSSSPSGRVMCKKMSSSEWWARLNSRNAQPRARTCSNTSGRTSSPARGVNAQRKYSPSDAAMSKCSISPI